VRLPSRRELLRGALVGAGLGAFPTVLRGARASDGLSAADRRFLFVYVPGGWDVTRVFAPLFGVRGVAMEADAVPLGVGDLALVDHPARPSVRRFFQTHGSRVAIVDGLQIASISHATCLRLLTTGTPDASAADWPSRIAAAYAAAHTVPCLVAGGPSFAGAYGVHVGHAGLSGQLQGLVTGEILARAEVPQLPLAGAAAADIESFLAGAASRARAGAGGGAGRRLAEGYGVSLEKVGRLRDEVAGVSLDRGLGFDGQVDLAARALSEGLSRCASVAHPKAQVNVLWDSHAQNDDVQARMFEDLFAALGRVMDTLAATPGASAATLADETVVVVLSEMGRTPYLNGAGGKDHWPYTSAMLLGPGVRGNVQVGGYDALQQGVDTDLESGAPAAGGTPIGPNMLGATLLALADIDPRDAGLVDPPIGAVLA
jgi:uncharacterized protein (DUF1501 family)